MACTNQFEILGLKSLGYENKVIFPITLKLKNKNKDINLVLNTNYLVCRISIPGNANLYLDIPVVRLNLLSIYMN